MNTRKTLFIFQLITIIFAIILGTLLHFTYKWSNKNMLVGAFSAVNESTWEHLKLLFFPYFYGNIAFYLSDNLLVFTVILDIKTIGISVLRINIFLYLFSF